MWPHLFKCSADYLRSSGLRHFWSPNQHNTRRRNRILTLPTIPCTTGLLLMYTIRPEDLWRQAKKPLCRLSISASQTWFSLCLSVTSLGITFLAKPYLTGLFFHPPLSYFWDGLDVHFLWDHYRPFQDSCSISSLDLKELIPNSIRHLSIWTELFKDIHYKMVPHIMPSA